MIYQRNELIGLVRSSARMAYMAAEGLSEFSTDPTNHLTPADATEIRTLIKSVKDSLKSISESTGIFERELEARKV